METPARPVLARSLALSMAGLAAAGGCATDASRVPFAVSGRIDATGACGEQKLSGLKPSTVRLSVRATDSSGAAFVCDALLDPASGSNRLVLPSGRADFFVEAFDEANRRIATGAALGVDTTAAAFPPIHLLPVEQFTCVAGPAAADAQPRPLRLAQHRAFHTATVLPNGQVLFLGGVTTTASGDSPASNPNEAAQEYFVTGAAEVYDPSTRQVVVPAGGGLSPRAFHHAALLDATGDGKYRVLVVGGVAPKDPAKSTLVGANRALAAPKAPGWFRFGLNPDNAVVAPSELLTYDASDPRAPKITHEPVPALAVADSAYAAGAALVGGGLMSAGGLQGSLQGAPPPMATTSLSVTRGDLMPAFGMLAAPRAGAALVALAGGAAGRADALLVGGLADGTAMPRPAPFARNDRRGPGAPAGVALAPSAAFPSYLFPTVTPLDPGAAAPRLLVSGGLEVDNVGFALEPPAATMQVLKYTPPAATVDVSPVAATDWKRQTMCEPGDLYRAVAFDAATLLASADGFLSGDRVLSTGGSPNSKCDECADMTNSHACALAQAAIVTVPGGVDGLPTLVRADLLQVARFGHTQSILPDHTVLVAGGLTRRGGATLGAVELELYNPIRNVPVMGETGDADDPLKAELKAGGYSRGPGVLAGTPDRPEALRCQVPHK